MSHFLGIFFVKTELHFSSRSRFQKYLKYGNQLLTPLNHIWINAPKTDNHFGNAQSMGQQSSSNNEVNQHAPPFSLMRQLTCSGTGELERTID